MDKITVSTVTVQWRGLGAVQCKYVSHDGWQFNFDAIRAAKNSDGQFRIPPHTTDEELSDEFERDLGDSNIGQWMGNVAGGDGKF